MSAARKNLFHLAVETLGSSRLPHSIKVLIPQTPRCVYDPADHAVAGIAVDG